MAQNTVTYELREDLQQIFIDASSLDAQLGSLVFWGIAVRITSPLGVAYQSPNYGNAVPGYLLRSDSGPKSISVAMPVGVNSKGIPGNWTFEIKICSQNPSTPTIELFSDGVEVLFPSPVVGIQQVVDVDASSLTSTDLTPYVQSNITPVVTRTHKVTYPLNVDVAPVENNQQQIVVTPIYDGQFRTDIDSLAVYTLPPSDQLQNRFKSRVRLRGFKVVAVSVISLNDIQQKLFDLNARYESQVSRGNPNNGITFNKITRCTQLLGLYEQAQRAGRPDLMSNYYNALVAILGADDVVTTVNG